MIREDRVSAGKRLIAAAKEMRERLPQLSPLCEECKKAPADLFIPNVEDTRQIPLCEGCLKLIAERVMVKTVDSREGAPT